MQVGLPFALQFQGGFQAGTGLTALQDSVVLLGIYIQGLVGGRVAGGLAGVAGVSGVADLVAVAVADDGGS